MVPIRRSRPPPAKPSSWVTRDSSRPGRVVGVELGCFHGTSTCAGQLTMSHDGTVIAQRDYSIPADSGGFQNMVLSSTGQQMLGSNGVWHLLPVTVTAKGSTRQTLSFVIHLARWVWH
jgi:hypothetical protein